MRLSVLVVLLVFIAGVYCACDSKNNDVLNSRPNIASATYVEATRTLTVAVNDIDNDNVTVTVTVPAGLAVDATSAAVAGGHGNAAFVWSATDAAAGGAGTATVTATDGITTDPETQTVAITVPVTVPPGPLTITAASAVDLGDGHATLTVTIAHTANATSSVAVAVPTGMTVDQPLLFVNTGNGNAVFTFTANDPFAGATGTVAITADDGDLHTAVATQTLTIAPVAQPPGPVIGAVTWTDNNNGTGVLSVPVTRATNADVTVSVTAIAGATFDHTTQVVTNGNGTAVFTLTEDTAGAGAAGNVTITADDGTTTDTAALAISLEHHAVVNPPDVQPDTLYAYPTQSEVSVGEPVTVMVFTGQTAHPLSFMSSVGITVETAGTYVPGSFNIGLEGGARLDTDGYWGFMGPPSPADGQYLDLGDALMPGMPTDIGGGLHRYNFAIVTQGPFQPPSNWLDNTEALFNFQLSFSAPGTYHLGFQLSDGAFDQTYYSDWNTDTYFWGTLDNTYTVTVN